MERLALTAAGICLATAALAFEGPSSPTTTSPAATPTRADGSFRVAQACGWYAIMICTRGAGEAQRWNSANGAGYVINTSSGNYPNFRGGYFCVVEGPQGKGAAEQTAAYWRRNGAPTAYVKNAC